MTPVATATTITKAPDLSAGVQVLLGGSPLDPSLLQRLVDLRVETTLGVPDECTLRLADSAFVGTTDLSILDDQRLKLGALVIVKLGRAIGGQLGPVFQGEVTAIEVDLDAGAGGGASQEVVIVAHDRSHRLHRTSTTRTFRQVTLADVARKVATTAGLRVGTMGAVAQGQPMETLTQVDESDWAFLSRLARDRGGELDVQAGALTIVDPKVPGVLAATLVWGEGLRRFKGRTSALSQVAQVIVRAWDPKGKLAVEGTGRPKASSSKGDADVAGQLAGTRALVSTTGATSAGEARAQAQAIAQRIGHERVSAEATATGDPSLIAGKRVMVKGVGLRFSGVHRIVTAVHHLSHDGYRTDLVLGAGGKPLAAELDAGPQRPPAFSSQLVVGIITSNTDPQMQGRVKVKYPTLDANTESGWARVARGASGQGRGAVATLEVNDEVVVGFEHGSPQKPIVLGAVFNGRDLPGAALPPMTGSLSARFPRNIDVQTLGQTELQAKLGLTVGAQLGPMELSAGGPVTLKATTPVPLSVETLGVLSLKGASGGELTTIGPLKINATGPLIVESTSVVQLKGSAIQIEGQGAVQVTGATVVLG